MSNTRSRCVETLIRRRDWLDHLVEEGKARIWDQKEIAALNRAIDALDHESEPQITDDGTVTYDGGTQWAVKRNDVGAPCAYMPMKSKRKAELKHAEWFALAQKKYPGEPELWPELVSARVVWRVEKS